MDELKFDRYFRFEIIYDEEQDAMGVGLEEYDPEGSNVDNSIFTASIYIKGDDDTKALDVVMRLILDSTRDDEKVTVRERGMYYIDLRDQYEEIAFRHLKSDRIGNVVELANKALDDNKEVVQCLKCIRAKR